MNLAPSSLAGWQADLERVIPRSTRLSWLRIGWRPDWQRLCLYQMFPPHAAPTMVLDPSQPYVLQRLLVLGQSHIRAVPDPRLRLRYARSMVTRYAWPLMQETGCYAQPFWVVQGRHGGHKWQFTPVQSSLAQLHGFPAEPPEPGSLPYAPFDLRVLAKVLALDDVRTWELASRWLDERDVRDLDAAEHATMVAMRGELWRWMETQVDQGAEEAGIRFASTRAAGYQDTDADYEAIQETFLTEDD